MSGGPNLEPGARFGRSFRVADRGARGRPCAMTPLADDVLDLLARAEDAHRNGGHRAALDLLGALKATGQAPAEADLVRARCFEALGERASATQARREYERLRGELPATAAVDLGEPDDERWFAAARAAIEPFTMLSPARIASLHRAAREALARRVPGDFVECGVAAGGSSALLCACLDRYGAEPSRRLHAFDTFAGMPPPTERDRDRTGVAAERSGWGAGTCAAPEASVRRAARMLGAEERLRTVVGRFEESLPREAASIPSIALLHLDGDWYESTRVCLEHLWDRLAPGALVQIDDYGHWEGCRAAVDEFLAARGERPSMERIDYTGVLLRRDGRGDR